MTTVQAAVATWKSHHRSMLFRCKPFDCIMTRQQCALRSFVAIKKSGAWNPFMTHLPGKAATNSCLVCKTGRKHLGDFPESGHIKDPRKLPQHAKKRTPAEWAAYLAQFARELDE